MKQCSQCSRELPLDAFNKGRAYCRECQAAYRSAYYARNKEREAANAKRYYSNNADELRAYSRKWRLEHPERVRESNKEWAAANRGQRLHLKRKYWAKHKDEIAQRRAEKYRQNPTPTYERWRRWREQHPAYHHVSTANRRAWKKRAGGKFTTHEWIELKCHYNHTCLCCGRREPDVTLTADHIIPLCMGGSNSIENIQPLCKPCNSSKATKTIDYRPDRQHQRTQSDR